MEDACSFFGAEDYSEGIFSIARRGISPEIMTEEEVIDSFTFECYGGDNLW